MAGFLSYLRVEELPDGKHWRLLEPCVYHLKDEDGEEWVEAPENFITDFGSIPRPLWSLPGLSPHGKWRRAYVIHDKLFQAPVVRSEATARAIGFREANSILKEAMGVLGAPWIVRQIVWTGVSTGGRLAWNRYRRQEAAV